MIFFNNPMVQIKSHFFKSPFQSKPHFYIKLYRKQTSRPRTHLVQGRCPIYICTYGISAIFFAHRQPVPLHPKKRSAIIPHAFLFIRSRRLYASGAQTLAVDPRSVYKYVLIYIYCLII